MKSEHRGATRNLENSISVFGIWSSWRLLVRLICKWFCRTLSLILKTRNLICVRIMNMQLPHILRNCAMYSWCILYLINTFAWNPRCHRDRFGNDISDDLRNFIYLIFIWLYWGFAQSSVRVPHSVTTRYVQWRVTVLVLVPKYKMQTNYSL